jgi:iron complex outermembrane receptor protein
MRKTALAVTVALFAACGLAAEQGAAEAPAADDSKTAVPGTAKMRFNIPPQALNQALNLFAQQADLRIVFDTPAAEGVMAPQVEGELTVRKALELLLASSKLTYRFMDARTVAIDAPAKTTVNWSGAERIRLAQSDPPTSRSIALEQIDEIVVTGSRLRSTGEGPAPVTTFDQQRMKQLGVTQVADVLNYLPQQSFQLMEGNTFGGSRTVQLRGLGLGTTLVLINGRRTVTSALQGGRNVFDLNMLPLAAVERIEVLSESASSVYGADAVGGVLNIILKEQIDRPTADLYYGGAQGGGEEQQASVAFSLPTDRLRTVFVLDYFDSDPLFGNERDLSGNADFRRFGGADQRVATANPGNICSLTGANLPGLTQPCAAVPQGSSGVGLTPADFVATAGLTNRYSPFSQASITPAAKRASAMAAAQIDFNSVLGGFGELMYVDRENVASSEPATLTAVVPPSNPFNPFGQPVITSYRFDSEIVGLRDQISETDGLRGVLGLTGEHSSWDWQTSFLYTRENATNFIRNQTDPVRVQAALTETDPAAALNVFQDGPGGSPEFVRSLLDDSPPLERYRSEARQLSGFARSALFDLPAGEVEGLVGAEAREESLMLDNPQLLPIDADRDTASGFVELRVPVLSSQHGQGLMLSAAGRYDDYDDFGSTFNPQFGATWQPLPSLLVRASYGTSFRAPSLVELYLPAITIPGVPLIDPARNEVVTVDLVFSGNENLDPEESETLSAGFVLTPSTWAGFKLAATYWRLAQDERVIRADPGTALRLESQFPELVGRAEATPADVAAGRPGRLLRVTSASVNAGRLDASGMDFEVSYDYQTRFGRWTPALSATWVASFESADLPDRPMVDRAGIAQLNGLTIPEWRMVGTLAWSRGGIGLSANARYTSSYDDVSARTAVATGDTVNPPVLVDLQASLDFGAQFARSGWTNGLVLRTGAFNVFDEAPRFAEVGGARGYDTGQGDLRGRFLYLRLSKAF